MNDDTNSTSPDSLSPTASFSPNSDVLGTHIGPYKLLQIIGEGGMGTVYMAEQEKPVRRRVALKIIKLGMDTRQIVARFEAERQALSMMDHPNIANVLDVGSTDKGRPFFVMELVKGLRITDYCDEKKLGVKQRLQLFKSVCEAVQHAHLKGIIHRDLKPSNILVGDFDDRAIPKIIDFGLAKALHQRLTEKTMFTQLGQVVGTLDYMSPEQSNMNQLDVDTRTDIYSLGVLLYELLSGTTPFDKQRLKSAALDQVLKIIRDEEPPRPSLRLSSVKSSAEIALSRGTEPGKLSGLLRGELDWIVMKALEKDRSRRYETANGLRMDIDRYLNDEPIVARPPSTAYRFSKLVQRNKIIFLAAAAVSVSLMIGLVAASWGLVETNRQRRIATVERDDAREARRKAELAENAAAERANQLERQNYLLLLARIDGALLRGDLVQADVALNACPENIRGWEWTFLRRRVENKFLLTIPGSEKPLFSQDGKRLFAIGGLGSADHKAVFVWDIDSAQKKLLCEHDSPLSHMELADDEQLIAAGDMEGGVFVFDVANRKMKWSSKPHGNRTDGLAFSPDGRLLATANWDGTAKVFDTDSGELRYTVGPFENKLRKPDFSPDGKWLTIGFHSGIQRALLVDALTGQITAKFPLDKHVIPTFSPDGELIATGNVNGTVTLWRWDGSELKQERTLCDQGGAIAAIDFSPNGKILAVGERTGRNMVKLFNVQTGLEIASTAMGDSVYWLNVNPTTDHIAIFTVSDGIQLWAFTESRDGITSKVSDAGIETLAFSPDGRRVLVGSWTRDVGRVASQVIDAATGNRAVDLINWRSGGCWTPDGKQVLISTSPNHDIQMLDSETGVVLRSFKGHTASSLPFVHRFGQSMTSVGHDGTARIWKLDSGEETGKLQFKKAMDLDEYIRADISRDGKLVAIAHRDQFEVELWDTQKMQLVNTIKVPTVLIWGINFSEDGKTVCLMGSGGTLAFFDAKTGQRTRDLLGRHESGHESVFDAAMNPDGSNMVSGGEEGRVIVWDVAEGQPLLTLHAGTEKVFAVDWSRDGQRIAAGFADGTVKIWKLF